jgi:hypothetical protein
MPYCNKCAILNHGKCDTRYHTLRTYSIISRSYLKMSMAHVSQFRSKVFQYSAQLMLKIHLEFYKWLG